MNLRMDVLAVTFIMLKATYVMHRVIGVGMDYNARDLLYLKGLASPARLTLT